MGKKQAGVGWSNLLEVKGRRGHSSFPNLGRVLYHHPSHSAFFTHYLDSARHHLPTTLLSPRNTFYIGSFLQA